MQIAFGDLSLYEDARGIAFFLFLIRLKRVKYVRRKSFQERLRIIGFLSRTGKSSLPNLSSLSRPGQRVIRRVPPDGGQELGKETAKLKISHGEGGRPSPSGFKVSTLKMLRAKYEHVEIL